MTPRCGGLKSYALLIFLCAALYVPGQMTLPPVDRDEVRYAQATRQMLERRDFVNIYFQDTPRHLQPIGIYWLQAAAVAMTGMAETNQIWPYRIPSLVGATLAVLLTFAFGKSLFDQRTAQWGAFLTASCLLLVVEAHLAKTDAMLLATIVAAQGSLGRLYIQAQRAQPTGAGTALTFWAAQGIGILIKGPVAPLVSILTIAALGAADRNLRWLKGLRFGLGVVLLAVIVCPWLISISIATKGAFLQNMFLTSILPKLISGQQSHGFVPGYYLLLMPVTLWPTSMLAGLGLLRAWTCRSWPAERFCLAWIVPTWLAFELIYTKLPHYILPTYPALALLTAQVISNAKNSALPGLHSTWTRALLIGWSLIGLFLAVAVVVLPWIVDKRFDPLALWPAAAAVAVTVLAVWHVFRGRLVAATIIIVLGSVLVFAPTIQVVLPRLNGLWLSRSVAQAVAHHNEPLNGPPAVVASCDFHEPSLVFMLGTQTKLVEPEEAALYLYEYPHGLVLTSDRMDAIFQRKMDELHGSVRLIDTISGFNYTKGRRLLLRLYTSDGSSPAPIGIRPLK